MNAGKFLNSKKPQIESMNIIEITPNLNDIKGFNSWLFAIQKFDLAIFIVKFLVKMLHAIP